MKSRVTKLGTKLALTLSRRRSLSYRNQSTDLQSKSMDWFLYDNSLCHERVKTWDNWVNDKTHTIFLRPPPHYSIIFILQEETYRHDSQLLTFINVNRDPAKKKLRYQMRTTCKILTCKAKNKTRNKETKRILKIK